MKLLNERILPKLTNSGNNLKELLNVTSLDKRYTAQIMEMGRPGQLVKALQ